MDRRRISRLWGTLPSISSIPQPTAPGSVRILFLRSLTAHLVLSPSNYPLHGNYDTYHAYLSDQPLGSLYANACIVFWTTVSLAAINWLIIGIARIISSWGRELSRSGSGMWHQFESIGFILASVTSMACSHRSPTFANRLGVDDLQYHVGRGLAHWSPQNVLPYNPPSDLADQSGDLSSVIYISP
ncbi:uncharacterized protein EDB91DRAFT_1124967, partial [Suillus paluster]|uniref:uncharacterized protein n=1 Tax=Suillus paluster TaxID=48578 RepID=UPI001B87F10F